jgi:hypothetical protein
LLATQGAIKTYVDANVTAQDLDIVSDSGSIDIDLDSDSLTLTGGTGLASSASSTTVTFAIDATVATLSGSQTLTNKTIAGGSNTLSAIANGSLTNSTVAYGGVTLALGASDATPAFNLSDATAYTGDSALVTTGTITSGTWQGTTVAVNQGGTGLASYTAGDVIYASGSTTLAKLAKGSDTEVLTLASGVPTWAAPTTGDLTAIVAGAGLTGTSLGGPIPTLNVIGTADKITVSADAVTIASGYVGQSSITTLGTIGTGVWNGTAITGAYIDPTSSPLANTKIWIGSASNVAAEFALSGDATMSAGGAVTVVAAPAGTLTGTTLKSTVVTSSLTAVGTIGTGVWNGTKVASAYLDDDTAHLSGTQTFSGAKTFSAALAASSTLAVTGATTLGNRVDHKTGATLAAQYGSGSDIGLNTSPGTTDFNIKAVGEFAVSAGASATTCFLIEGTAASITGTLAVTSTLSATDITASGDVIIGTNPADSGDIRLNKNFGILARNQENDGDMYAITSGHVTGNAGSSPALASLEIGSNSANTWAAIRFHAGAINCMVITPTTVVINKDLTIPTATFAQNLPTSSDGLASGRMWVDSGTVKVIA